MKRIILLFAIICNSFFVFSQNQEFEVYSNGFIYSETAMTNLAVIVDSLNLKYKTCDPNPTFYSRYQNLAHIIELDTGDLASAAKDIESEMGIDEFLAKYPQAQKSEKVLVFIDSNTNYEGERYVSYKHFDLTSNYGFSVSSNDPTEYPTGGAKHWQVSDYRNDQDEITQVKGFYFEQPFTSQKLPSTYALKIGYADCLIDTNTMKFKEEAEFGSVPFPNDWQQLSLAEKEDLLDEMRSTRVMGFCSQDSRPREHAVNIALLSAETYHWEVFLRAHLDIMNDRFDRAVDGSYAWAGRKTYLRELEELDINVVDLLLGVSLRIENPSQNHYWGSISRIGRAFAETQNQHELENALVSGIADQELDDFNRLIMYYLFKNYIYYLPEEDEKELKTRYLKDAVGSLPSYYSKILLAEE